MSKIIKTQIDGIPVELEIVNVGPASPEDLQKLGENLSKETIAQQEIASSQIKVIKVGSETNPATPEEVKSVNEKVTTKPAELIGNLLTSLAAVGVGKKWYSSKIIWVNIAAIITALCASFGFNVPIDPQLMMTVFPLVLGFINIWLRKTSSGKIIK